MECGTRKAAASVVPTSATLIHGFSMEAHVSEAQPQSAHDCEGGLPLKSETCQPQNVPRSPDSYITPVISTLRHNGRTIVVISIPSRTADRLPPLKPLER